MIVGLLARSLIGRIMICVSLICTAAFVLVPDDGLLVGIPFILATTIFFSQRATLFEAVLPIRAREIFVARLLFALALTWLPLAVWITVPELQGGPAEAPGDLFRISSVMKFEILGLTTFALILPNAIRPGLLKAGGAPSMGYSWAVVAIAGMFGVVYLAPATMLTVVGLSCIAAFHITWSHFPESFQLAPSDVTTRQDVQVRVRTGSNASSARWWRPLLRSGFNLMLAVSAFSALSFSSGGTPLTMLVLYGPSALLFARSQTRWLIALPLSPRKLLWINMGATVTLILGGLLVGAVLHSNLRVDSMTRGAPFPRSRTEHFYYHTTVSLAFWPAIPDGGKVPEISAPWGETSPAQTVSVFGTTYYNPYSATRSSTKEFRAWQFERASRALYGKTIHFAQYDTGSVAYPPRVNSTTNTRIITGALATSFVLLVLFLCEFPRWHLFGRRKGLRVTAITIAAAPLLTACLVEMFYMITQGVSFAPLLERVVFALSLQLPHKLWQLLVVSSLPVIAIYALIEWQFRRSEITDRVVQQRAW